MSGSERSRNYRDLIVWQKAITLVKQVYMLARKLPDTERFGLSQQLRRAAVSVPANIAEGQGRGSAGDFRRFIRMARGSLAELETHLYIASELDYLSPEELRETGRRLVEVRKMLSGLHASLEGPNDPEQS